MLPSTQGDDEISTGHEPTTETLPLRSVGVELGRNQCFAGLRRFRRSGGGSRNSYRSQLCHLYELVKFDQTGPVQYSDSEKTFKALTEHGLT